MPSTRFLIAALLSSLSLLPSTTSTPNQSPGKRFSYAEYLEGKQIPLGPSLAGGEAARVLDAAAEGVVPPVVLDSTGNGPASVSGWPKYATDYWGLKTLFHLPPVKCLTDESTPFDVAILGAPFDTATSYRPGARFGPRGIRGGGQRTGGFNRALKVNPFEVLKMVDCGDSRMTFYSNELALKTLEDDYISLLTREVAAELPAGQELLALDGKQHPRVMMLGGDHTIVLPALRALHPIYGPLSVIHFDSHCDSRHPGGDPLTHGDYFYYAWVEGLLRNTSIHAGIRVPCDEETDNKVGFTTIVAEEIEDIKYQGVIKRIRDRVGDSPIYLTIDIDTLDPAFAPATGTPEIGGWTTREMKKILHGLRDLKIVGADVVEVAPVYDIQAEITQIAAAGLVFELVSMMALTPLTA